MSLLELIVVLVIVGVALYVINQYVPMDGRIKTILNIAVVAFLVLWFLQKLGLLGALGAIRLN